MEEKDIQHAESFRDRLSSTTASGKRKWIYALKPSGFFTRFRNYLSYGYLAVFFVLPFIKVNGHPLFLINIIDSKFILFGKIFWPQDFFILALAMIFLIIFIILFTVIYGRLFCGWTCPQTVFMEFIFRKIEWWIEGSPARQLALNNGPWTTEKIWKKGVKHFLFLVISFLIAHTFLAYILGMDGVLALISQPISQNLGLFFGLVIFTLLFYSVFAFVREIVCTTICPYGRLQSVMFDKDTMQVAYDYNRGEPRERLRKKETRTAGDCIDCHKCVMVCPTGIDIRDGVQMECVGCTACIDACDEVMDKVGFARGLIRYASENQITNRTPFKFNTRAKAYSVLLILLSVGMGIMTATRKPVDTYVNRVKGQLYQQTDEGNFSNLFEARIVNKTVQEFPVNLKLENMPGEINLIGHPGFQLSPESINTFTFFVEIPQSAVQNRSNKLQIGVYRNNKRIQLIKTKFLGPFK